MDNTVKTKQEDMEKLLGQVQESRKSKILGPTFDKEDQLKPSGLCTVNCDFGPQQKMRNCLCWFVEDTMTRRYGTWPQQKWYPQTFLGFKLTAIFETEPPREALEALDRIHSSALYYYYMAARPTRAVMESWNVACQDSKTYIYPGMKADHKPEKIREETVAEIHPWLKDEEKIACAYKLRTADETSKLSGWSDEFAIPVTGAVSLPVFRLDNFGFRIAT
ncbi:hypothetical protein N7523_000764 [Penicillium sp. IBT 18751x]|nr:hypothetical protein N7523_000764 [Penicillium sp. IBT 18751x]